MNNADILTFLTGLSQNNNREWFEQHKDEYLACRAQFTTLTEQLIRAIGQVDEGVASLQAKECIWRIYRDVRFSPDKRPYKEWFGTFLAPQGGKKSLHGGYYIQLQPQYCMFSAGIWNPSPDLLKRLRQSVLDNYEELESVFASPAFQQYFTDFDTEWMLKRVPMGFDQDFVHADWLKRKAFTVSHMLTDQEACAPDFVAHMVQMAEAVKPLNDFLNYTVDEFTE